MATNHGREGGTVMGAVKSLNPAQLNHIALKLKHNKSIPDGTSHHIVTIQGSSTPCWMGQMRQDTILVVFHLERLFDGIFLLKIARMVLKEERRLSIIDAWRPSKEPRETLAQVEIRK
jgi:hypothetical protein